MERVADWAMKRRARGLGGKRDKRPGWPVAVVALAGLAALLYFYFAHAWQVRLVDEDAYISLRYARNLIEGHGLVFNPGGERVEGITNLLWTLSVALVSWVSGVGLPRVALLLGVFCGALTLLVAYRWCQQEALRSPAPRWLAHLAALGAPLLMALAPGFTFYSASGLEVGMFALLLTAGLYVLSRAEGPRGFAVGSLLLGAAAITRPEGGLALVLGSAFCVLRYGLGGTRSGMARRFAVGISGVLPGALVLAGVSVWRWLYYGAVIPNTAFAKAGGMEVVERWGLPYLLDAAQGAWIHLAYFLILCGALLNRGFLVRSLAVLFIVPLWCAYVVYVGGDYMPFHRLLVPILPALYVLAVAGVINVFASLPGFSQRFPGYAKAAAVALPLAGLTFLFAAQFPQLVDAEQARKAEVQEDIESWRAAARWFEENDPNAVVARNAVGTFGYYAEDTKIIDMLGLNNEYIARHGTKEPENLPGHQSGDGPYVLSREPEYIMVSETKPPFRFVTDRELANSPRFHEEYERITVERDNGQKMNMFVRKEDAGPR